MWILFFLIWWLFWVILNLCKRPVFLDCYISHFANIFKWRRPVRIRVRKGPLHPLANSRCGTIKIPPYSKALSAEHRPKLCSPSPVMVTSPCKWKILEWDDQANEDRKRVTLKFSSQFCKNCTGKRKPKLMILLDTLFVSSLPWYRNWSHTEKTQNQFRTQNFAS
jgi:hypothetical protein